jgi:hypothetical protein
MGFICAARTVHRHPLGGTVGIPEVSIERLVGLNGPLGSHLSPILGMGGGKIEASTRCCREFFACCTAVVPRMLFNRWYISLTSMVEGAGNVSRSAAIVGTFSLALAMVGSCHSTCSIATDWPTSSADLHWRRSVNLASTAAHS